MRSGVDVEYGRPATLRHSSAICRDSLPPTSSARIQKMRYHAAASKENGRPYLALCRIQTQAGVLNRLVLNHLGGLVKTTLAPQAFGGGLSHSVVAAPSAPLESINQRSEN